MDSNYCGMNFLYHPTTIAIVDDNISYLSNIRFQLSKNWPTILFDDPQKALLSLKNREISMLSHMNEVIAGLHIDTEQDGRLSENSRTVKINISNIYKRIYDGSRFSKISSALIDFDMPGMDGLEFCKKLVANCGDIRKIMLTGKADSNTAVKAFNNNIIDKFIVKGTDDSLGILSSVLLDETKKYFTNLSKAFYEDFIIHRPESPMINKYYRNIFEEALRLSNFIEYYLLDFSGSFLFLNKNAVPTILLVKSKDDLDSYLKIALDSGANESIIEKLQSKSHLLYLLSDDDYNYSPDDWGKFLYPAIESADGTFYYAILNKEIHGIDLSKVKSFDNYMCQLSF